MDGPKRSIDLSCEAESTRKRRIVTYNFEVVYIKVYKEVLLTKAKV